MGSNVIEWGGHLAAAVIAHAISVSVVAALLRRRRFAGERVAGATVMRYPRGWHLFAWTFLVLPLGGLAFLAWRFPPKPSEVVHFVGLVAAFGLLGAYFVLEVSGVAHEVQANGLVRHGVYRPRRFLPWAQVVWHLRTRSGDGAWVPFQLSGIGAFAAAALQQVAPEVLDREPGTRAMLERLAAGIPGRGVTHP